LTARELGEYLVSRPGEKARLLEIFHALPLTRQSSILRVCKDISATIFEALAP
jgi:hypothetical protein